jgi:two-component system response regulator
MGKAFSIRSRLLGMNQPALQIILIDDAQHDLDAQRRTLESCKLLNEIKSFKSAEDAVAFFRAAQKDENARFLVFLDLIMKPNNGTYVLRALHDEKLSIKSIVVMLSGLADVKLLHEGYQLGAHTFLVKPLKVQDVMELVATLKHSIAIETEDKGNRLVWK